MQATVHMKGKTECFECSRRPAAKGFPICTIRNTPEKPIHCIVWAKDLLFERLFSPAEAINDLDEAPAEVEDTADAAALADAGLIPQRVPQFRHDELILPHKKHPHSQFFLSDFTVPAPKMQRDCPSTVQGRLRQASSTERRERAHGNMRSGCLTWCM